MGLLPKNEGVAAGSAVTGEVKFNDRWWPSKRQPQGWCDAGSPKIVR